MSRMNLKINSKRVVVVGAGAAGMVAAITAARAGAQVTVLERGDRAGRKLAQTGNGRCNLTNLKMEGEAFRGEHPEFAMQVISRFDVKATLAFFEELGIYPKFRGDYVYPNSDQAASVPKVLLDELAHLGVRIVYGVVIERIETTGGSSQDRVCRNGDDRAGNDAWSAAGYPVLRSISGDERRTSKDAGRTKTKSERGFRIRTNGETYQADSVILACGSKAAPGTGAGDSGYALAKQLGHRIVRMVPALTAIRCIGKYYPQMAGVRTEAEIRLFVNHAPVAADRGELQLTDYGISGIPVFQLSRFAAYGLLRQQDVRAVINFLPQMDTSACLAYLLKRRNRLGFKQAEDFLSGMVNGKLAQVMLKLSGISGWEQSGDISDAKLRLLAKNLTAYEAKAASVNPFANAQVCAGGVDTAELDSATMESRLVPGLYIAGELADIDGICGGYNLQWAWSSGYVAGKCAAGA